MDYEKKYNEALEKARIINSGKYVDIPVEDTVLEYVFPELKENENEKIRKELVQYLTKSKEIERAGSLHGNFDEWITWLEKQGKKVIPKNIDDAALQYVDTCTVDGEVTHDNITEPYWNNHSMMNAYKAGWLEKQGKNPQGKSALEDINEEKIDKQNCIKPADFKAEHFYVSKVDGQIHDMTYNPTDKVEPKFRNGQWIVWQDKCYKVNYNGCGYELIDQNGLSTSLEYKTVDESAHLWDIVQDAKDGDVLVVPPVKGSEHSEQIFIFKEIKDREYVKNAVEYYCRCMDNEFSANERGFMGQSDDYFTPATKEQHDTLFTKMREAGYKWDAEKKELMKIKQEDDTSIAINNEKAYKIGFADGEAYAKEQLVWSEEDERNMKNIDSVLFYDKSLSEDTCMRLRNWLKSLKQRIGE